MFWIEKVYLTWILVFLLGLVGWVINVVKIIASINDPLTTEIIVRLVGVFVLPLGAIMGIIV